MSVSWNPWAGDEPQVAFEDTESEVPLPRQHVAVDQDEHDSGRTAAYSSNTPEPVADFIFCLALAQALRIDFVPISWHPELEIVGGGATAEIRKALVNVQMSLAFKRIVTQRHHAFRSLVAEISILGHPAVIAHENIIRLEGMCWDVNPVDSIVWPVLIFEKAPHGSLDKFSRTDTALSMSFNQRLSVLKDIANALACLHSIGRYIHLSHLTPMSSCYPLAGVIHGDITPRNILIFDNQDGGQHAKLADLGFSTIFHDNQILKVSTNEPWAHPKYRGERLSFAAGKKMDAYSFGLICAWFLSHGVLPNQAPEGGKDAGHLALIRRFNLTYDLEGILHMLAEISDSTAELRSPIEKILRLTLVSDMNDIADNFEHILSLFDDTRFVPSRIYGLLLKMLIH